MSDGTRTNTTNGVSSKVEEIRFDPSKVRKVVINHSSYQITGIKLFDANNSQICKAGLCTSTDKEYLVNENERWIGIKARNPGNY